MSEMGTDVFIKRGFVFSERGLPKVTNQGIDFLSQILFDQDIGRRIKTEAKTKNIEADFNAQIGINAIQSTGDDRKPELTNFEPCA